MPGIVSWSAVLGAGRPPRPPTGAVPGPGRRSPGLGLVRVDFVTSRAHHHAVGVILDAGRLVALEAAVESEKGGSAKEREP
ncbi:hypothetical protein GCM10010305_37650 [Streptomyces termitum]|uniref:Uncharacterized protein n=1 Tax=Streptomyces termitum TaxID=67368 RepID=A0A918T8A5_9ACTN|nr:hypothetical protein GCM10010305_37650 [Streptomyces termitum]